MSDACWLMNTTDKAFFGGRYHANLEAFYEGKPAYIRDRRYASAAVHILGKMCGTVCPFEGYFACGGVGCTQIHDCTAPSTAVVPSTPITSLGGPLFTVRTEGNIGGLRHVLAINRSTVAITLYGQSIDETQRLPVFDTMVRLSRRPVAHWVSSLAWHMTFGVVLHPAQWQGRPEAEVIAIDIIHGWDCEDDMFAEGISNGCATILPLGCAAEVPAEARVADHGSVTVGDLCKVSCGTCDALTIPAYDPAPDVCAADAFHCINRMRATLYETCEAVKKDINSFIPCYIARYCPDVTAEQARKCEAACDPHYEKCDVPCKRGEGRTCEDDFFAAQQTDDGYVFCVDVLTGEELANTRVPSERREELTCQVLKVTKRHVTDTPRWKSVAHSRIMTRTATVAHFHAGKARSRALRGLLIKAVPEAEFTFTRDNRTGASVVTASPSVTKLLQQQREKPHSNFGVLGFAAAMEVERGVAGFLRASLDTPFTIESAMELALYEPERRLDTLREDTAVAEIPGKVVVTVRLAKKMRENVAHISVAFQNGFEQEQPKGGFYWGLYAQRMDGKCPIPDDAVFDPTGVGMVPNCLVGTSVSRSWSCRLGDLTRKLGKLQHNATFVESKISLSGQGSVLGTVLVVRGHGWTHCALLTAPAEVGGTALVADFSHETTQTSGVELSGSVNIWQKGPWEDTLISVSLRAGEELRNVSFHISSKRLEEYPEGCAAGYTPDTDLYDPFAVVLATLGRSVPRSSPSECLAKDGPSDTLLGPSSSPSDDTHYEYRCPLGDLTPHMRAAYIATKASNPANSNAAPVVYNYSVSHTYLNVAGTPGALRPNSELFRGGHTLVLLREGKVLACAQLQGKGPSDHSTAAAEARPTTPTADAGMSVLAMCLVVAGALFVALLVGYVVGMRCYTPTPTPGDGEGKDVEDDM